MVRIVLRTTVLAMGMSALASAAWAAGSLAGNGNVGTGTAGASTVEKTVEKMNPPLQNWSAPQFLDATQGVSASRTMNLPSDKVSAKAVLNAISFTAIVPCRLVDTRGVFSPVYAGGPFAAGEIRTYRTQGNCALPAGTNRIEAVSIAITTPPTSVTGEIETVPHGGVLGNTVDMVIQASQWNSVSAVVRVDANGDFDTQLRYTPGNVVIDLNGYYTQLNAANTSDYFNVVGNYNSDGGLLYSLESGAVGAAVRAQNNVGSDARLAQGVNAIDVAGGGLRVRGAGVGTPTFVFQHTVNTAGPYGGAGTLCGTSSVLVTSGTILDNPYTNGNPNAILFVTPTSGNGTSYGNHNPVNAGFVVFYGPVCTNDTSQRWAIFSQPPSTALPNGETFNVMVIVP
jgi:hypothetical protein